MVNDGNLPLDGTEEHIVDNGPDLEASFKEEPKEGDMIQREVPEQTQARIALVGQWVGRVKHAKSYFKPVHDRMREDMDFAIGKQWVSRGKLTAKEDAYVANITLRHIQQKVSGLYARNPKIRASVKRRLMSSVWDGSQTQVMQAMQISQADPMNLNALQIMRDYNSAMEHKKMLDAISRTLEVVYDQNIAEQEISFKVGMKSVVRRAVTTGVGFVKLGFQRVMKMDPEVEKKVADYSQRLATLERISADRADKEMDDDNAQVEQLRLLIEQMQMEEEIVAKEGLSITYPEATAIIPDPQTKMLRGFVGADWVAEEYILTPDQIKEIYRVDVGKNYRSYMSDDGGNQNAFGSSETYNALFGDGENNRKKHEAGVCVVWDIYSRKDGLVYTVCDGYPDFLSEPSAPDVWVEQFWPWFTLTLNDTEHYDEIYPPSDVHLIRDMQQEINRSRQGLREHRVANRPKTAVAAGLLDEEDVEKLQYHPANAVLELNGLQPGQKVEDLLQPIKMPGLDPNLYDVSPAFQDIERAVGVQEANLGGTSKGTATESSIAESSRMTQMASNIDDLNDLLTDIARTAGQILLTEISAETAKRIAGPGAVWPQLSREEIAAELDLKIEGGSTGRPNQAIEIANFEKMMPVILQLPGINPEYIARELLRRLDDNLDLDQAFVQGVPSIVAQNAAQRGGGQQPQAAGKGPQADPAAQGAKGGNNAAPEPPESRDPLAAPRPKLHDYVRGQAM